MLTPVERVLIFKRADLLANVGPRHLLGLAEVAREIGITKGETIYNEDDPADALYMVVTGRVRLSIAGRTNSEVGPGEAFGTWALVDDSSRGQRAECVEDGLVLALHREDFYDMAAGDLTLLQEVVRVLAKRLRALVSERPEEARVEAEGIENPEARTEAETVESFSDGGLAATAGAALEAAALGQTEREVEPPPGEGAALEPSVPVEPPKK